MESSPAVHPPVHSFPWHQNEEVMRVSDLMQANLETVSPDTAIDDVFVTLADLRVSALPVVDSAGRLVGVISKTDMMASEEDATGEPARAALFETTLVRDLMSSPVVTIAADASIRDAAQQMLSTGVHRLFVTSEERPIGVISVTDILAALAAGRL
jgi:CBS domain-containing protein